MVTLQRQRPTLLNGQVIHGIVPARAGDVLTVGDHQIVLRVASPDELAQAEPLGDGTLLIKERTDSAKSGDPVLALSVDDLPSSAPTMSDEALPEEAQRFLPPWPTGWAWTPTATRRATPATWMTTTPMVALAGSENTPSDTCRWRWKHARPDCRDPCCDRPSRS